MKYSRQRELILKEIKNTNMHPTAEGIYTKLKKTNPSLSLGTVYRNLNLFLQEGIIDKLVICNGPDRFDADTFPHSHLFCEQCGRVLDIDEAYLDDINSMVEEKTKHKIHSHSIVFQGICEECINQN